jgi:uncharacterized membrane protein YbhN (UPF0104 family)
MKRKTSTLILQLVIFAAVGGGIVWYMITRMSTDDRRTMITAIRDTNLIWMVPFFLTFLLSHWARARRWMVMLDPVGIHPTTANTTFAVLIGYLVNLIPPRAGEVAKCTVLAEYENMPADKMIGTIVAERSFDVLCLLLVIGLTFYWQGGALNTYLEGELRGHTPSAVSLITTAAIIAVLVIALVTIYKRSRQSRIGRFIAGLAAGFTSIFHLRKKSMFLVYTLLIWGAYVAQIIFGFHAMPATESLGIGVAMMVLVFGSAAIIAAPGGIGLYPFLIGKLLHFGYGLSEPAANAFGWVTWMALTAATLLAGVASLILLPIYNRAPHDSQAPVDPEPDL